MDARLPLTGERTAPGWASEAYWFARHECVYSWAAAQHAAPGSRVIDVGSGEGYGSALISESGAWVIGVELDRPTVAHAAAAYPDVSFVAANVVALPFADRVADLVISLQVIEHIWDVPSYLAELRRINRGTVIVSTPNRPIFSPGLQRGERPHNPFHVEEFDAEQLSDLLSAGGFTRLDILGLHHGAQLRAWEMEHGSIIQALHGAVLDDIWPEPLTALLACLTAQDFVINEDCDSAHDLIAIAS